MKQMKVEIDGIEYVPKSENIPEKIKSRYMFILDISPSVDYHKQILILKRMLYMFQVKDKDSEFNIVCSPGLGKVAVSAFDTYKDLTVENIVSAISPIRPQKMPFNLQGAISKAQYFPTKNVTMIIITDGFF